MSNAAPRPSDVQVTSAAISLLVVSLLPVFLAPLLSSYLKSDLGLSTALAGTVVSVTQGSLAVGALGIVPLLARSNRLLLGVSGMTLSLLGWSVASVVTATPAVIGAQVAVGLGAGVASATGNATLSHARNSVRAFSVATVVTVLIGSALLAGLPTLASASPFWGLFTAAAGIVVVALGVALSTPRSRAAIRFQPAARSVAPSGVESEPADVQPWLRGPAALLVLAMLALSIGNFAMWTFAAEIGQVAGLSSERTVQALGITQILGLAGALFAAVTRGWVGRWPVLPGAILIVAVGNLLMGLAPNGGVFFLGLLAVNLAYYCFTPLMFAAAADLDPAGRLAAVVGGASLVGGFLAPVLGAAVAGAGDDWVRMSVAAAVLIVLAVPLVVVAQRGRKLSGELMSEA